jgi:hypothetical protein
MSFNGIDRKLLNGAYSSFADFGADVEQVLANCHHFISDELPTCIYRDASALQLAYRKAAAEKPSSQALEVDTCNMTGPPQKTLSASAQNPIEQAPICKYSLLDKPKPLSSKKKGVQKPDVHLAAADPNLESLAQAMQNAPEQALVERALQGACTVGGPNLQPRRDILVLTGAGALGRSAALVSIPVRRRESGKVHKPGPRKSMENQLQTPRSLRPYHHNVIH